MTAVRLTPIPCCPGTVTGATVMMKNTRLPLDVRAARSALMVATARCISCLSRCCSPPACNHGVCGACAQDGGDADTDAAGLRSLLDAVQAEGDHDLSDSVTTGGEVVRVLLTLPGDNNPDALDVFFHRLNAFFGMVDESDFYSAVVPAMRTRVVVEAPPPPDANASAAPAPLAAPSSSSVIPASIQPFSTPSAPPSAGITPPLVAAPVLAAPGDAAQITPAAAPAPVTTPPQQKMYADAALLLYSAVLSTGLRICGDVDSSNAWADICTSCMALVLRDGHPTGSQALFRDDPAGVTTARYHALQAALVLAFYKGTDSAGPSALPACFTASVSSREWL